VSQLVARENPSIDEFKRDIRRKNPSIIHITWHGSEDENAVCFVEAAVSFSASQIKSRFLVTLSATDSS
jgi:hypothetical protein